MLIQTRRQTIIWEKELYTFIKLQLRKKAPNSEQFGERFARLMGNKELSLQDLNQIFQPEQWVQQ